MRTPTPWTLTLTLALTLATALPIGTADPVDAASDDVTLTIEAPAKVLALNEPFTINYTIAAADIAAINATGIPNMLDLLIAAAADLDFTQTHAWMDFDGDGLAESAYVEEINGLAHFADGLVYAWAVIENGDYAPTGANGVTVDAGDDLLFRYEGWLVPV